MCSCGKENKRVEPGIDQVRSVCELATLKCYYNNVIKSEKDSGSGLWGWLKKDRKFWIEYTGTVKIGIDASCLKIELKDDDTIVVSIPEAKIMSTDVDENTLSEDSFILSEDGWLIKNKISAEDQSEAIKVAEKKMKDTVQQNKSLFATAQDRAKKMIKNYIDQIGNRIGKKYRIEWEQIESENNDETGDESESNESVDEDAEDDEKNEEE